MALVQTAVAIVVFAILFRYVAEQSELKAESWNSPTPLPNLETNDILARFGERILKGNVLGPESLVFDSEGYLFTGLMDGRIIKINTKTLEFDTFAQYNSSCKPVVGLYDDYPPEREPLCGRPLGLRFDKEKRLLVAESYSGLHRLSADGKAREVLVDKVEGRSITFINDVDVASDDGTIYFTETSDRWGRSKVVSEIIASRPVGTLVSFHPSDPYGTMKVYRGFLPCNGVTLSHDEKSVFFVSGPRIYKLDRASQTVSLALDNAPAVMDNIRRRKGIPHRFLIGCASKRAAPFSLPDVLAPYPAVRNVMSFFLPQWVILKFIPRMGMLLEVDLTPGKERVVRSFQDRRSDGIAYVSEGEEHSDGFTYIGTWHEDHLVRAKTKDLLGD